MLAILPVFLVCSPAAVSAGAKDPKALETLVKSMNVKTESVNRDLTAYKGILSKLNAAKELMAELMAREKRKQEERWDSVHSILTALI